MSTTSAGDETRTADPAAKTRFVRRAGEWVWGAGAVARARASQQEQQHAQRCARRARIAAEVADRTLEPSAPWSAGGAEHLAAGLFAESIGWSLRLATCELDEHAAPPPEAAPERTELDELLSRHRGLLGAAVADDELITRVVDRLLGRLDDVYSTSAAEAELAARELGRVAHGLLRASQVRPDELDRLYFRRLWRTGLCGLVLFAAAMAAVSAWNDRERKNDLARAKPWTTSSTYENVCQSPQHDCEGKKTYFFHTHEEARPWLEIDLQREESFSAVQVFNRQDCCGDRSVPLAIEISSDQKTWREIARRTELFEVWKAKFSTVKARYVRLRVARRSILHLQDVRVLR